MTRSSAASLRTRSRTFAASLTASLLLACLSNHPAGPPPPDSARAAAFLDSLEERTFHYFWDLTNPQNGLTPDRAPSPSFSSIAAVGFALTAYPIGVERRYITRAQAAQRTLTTLRFFWTAPQDSAVSGSTGYHGFFYHFLDIGTGQRFQNVELSTIDTSLLLGGILLSQSYYDAADPVEAEIRRLADSIYLRVDWNWAAVRPPPVSMGWHPEGGFIPADWIGYNEAMILNILALGSPTHAVDSSAWAKWVSGYQWGRFQGQDYVQFGPLFGHEYSHVWIDFRGIQDSYMRDRGIDYFENSRRATYAHRGYAAGNPMVWNGYSDQIWGLTACDGPVNATGVAVERATVDPTLGWFDVDYLGIDQGPILAMIENYRSELIWRTMRRNPYIVRGLKRAGFTGGWIGGTGPAR